MHKLIVPASPMPDSDGSVLTVTPASAGWSYVGFEVFRLKPDQVLSRTTGANEVCLVLLSGSANIQSSKENWSDIGQRMSVFEKIPPYSIYIPSQDTFQVTALTELELAVCSAPGGAKREARLIPPNQVGAELRGSGSTERLVHNILPESEAAESLLVVEVFTPEGHWSSYPPHKHDRDALPDESLLEETYYYRIQPEQGFAIQRVYTDDLSLNETLTVQDGEAVMVPKGYHPVSAPPGYEVYYLNVMAGPVRAWKFQNDPAHDWLMNWKS
ncbi:5-deoxy-glucuronate isomerase [Paenibacillus dokdonensis]|uniref:5-deoxy-glucuronate isomerase n=1 Tax=Paenibacillus dokdonensis TaxID=2567944 RepID=UPI0010A7685A|nr:5-deoxy-glucuronate isomerase [Paenibacillus dokdonensis]